MEEAKVTTFNQVQYHLLQGKVLLFEMNDGNCCIEKIDELKIRLTLFAEKGAPTYHEADFDELKEVLNDIGEYEMYVFQKSEIYKAKLSLLDRCMDFFRSLRR